MITRKQVLELAKKLIADPANWTKHEYENDAGQYCAIGAVHEALLQLDPYGPHSGMEYRCTNALDICVQQLGLTYEDDDGEPMKVTTTIQYNDRLATQHEDIMRLYDCAIARASGDVEELVKAKP